jgi:DNA polymerase-4
MRRIAHVDMDAFFAAIELRRHPELRGRPLVIGGRGDPQARGVVSTASYEARAFGIRSGMPLRTAWRRCPQAVFLPVDFDAYARVSQQVKQLLQRFSPLMEDAGIDEVFLDISSNPEPSEEIGRAIQQCIGTHTGLSCSVGVAPNKLLAKIASDMHKPGGLTVLRRADVGPRVWPLPVRKLWGVGPKTEARLGRLGVHTIGELAQLSPERLGAEFGLAHGQYLHEAAHGIDDSPLITHWEPKSLSHETTFQRDVGDWERLRRATTGLTGELVGRLRAEGYRARQLSVKLRYADFETHSHAVTLPAASDDLETLQDAAQRCLRLFPLTRKVRLVGVRVGALDKSDRGSATR